MRCSSRGKHRMVASAPLTCSSASASSYLGEVEVRVQM